MIPIAERISENMFRLEFYEEDAVAPQGSHAPAHVMYVRYSSSAKKPLGRYGLGVKKSHDQALRGFLRLSEGFKIEVSARKGIWKRLQFGYADFQKKVCLALNACLPERKPRLYVPLYWLSGFLVLSATKRMISSSSSSLSRFLEWEKVWQNSLHKALLEIRACFWNVHQVGVDFSLHPGGQTFDISLYYTDELKKRNLCLLEREDIFLDLQTKAYALLERIPLGETAKLEISPEILREIRSDQYFLYRELAENLEEKAGCLTIVSDGLRIEKKAP